MKVIRIKPGVWQTWMDQWAELIESGMPAIDALTLSQELQNPSRQTVHLRTGLAKAAQFLREGQNLLTAFRAAFGALPAALEVSLICAQASGDTGTALRYQLQRWKAESNANQQLQKSMIYPTVVLLLSVMCWVFLHQVSAPHSSHLGENETPFYASVSNLLMLAGVLLLLLVGAMKITQPDKHGHGTYIRPYQAKTASSFYHLIGSELQAGLDLMHCLRQRPVSGPSCFNGLNPTSKAKRHLNELTGRVSALLRQGMPLGQALQAAGAPEFLVKQGKVAEQTGNLAHCFFLAAKVYDLQAKQFQEKLQAILPPVGLAIAASTLAMAYQFTLAPLYGNLAGGL